MLEDKNSNKEILERLDQYRAIEINNLWQRSVFLGTFLVLGYTGYGFLLDKIVSISISSVSIETKLIATQNVSIANTVNPENFGNSGILHFLACALASINIIFSALWIAMAKGSKAWYEVYENAIISVENEFYWKEIRDRISLNREDHKTGTVENIKNDCLFSTKAGGYSPSKINIAIGQISFVIWMVVFIVHLLISCCDLSYIKCECALLILLVIIVFTTVLIIRHCDWVKSSYFKD